MIDGFLVCLAGMLLVGSGLADRFGRRRMFLLGLAGFGAASLLAAASQNVAELIAARVLMGAAAACVLPPALSLIAVMFSAEERPRALAVWTSVAGVGFALGPVLGGVLVQSVGWQAVFLVNVPVVIAALPLGALSLPESRRPGAPALDAIGVDLSIVALALIVFALIEGVHLGWSNPAVLVAAVGGLAAGVAFVRHELVRRAPLFDVTALLRPVVATGALVIVTVYISFFGLLFLLSQYLYYVRHESTLYSGLLLAPLGVVTVVVAPLVPRLMGVVGRRVTVAGGLAAMSAAVALLLLIHRNTGRPFVLIGVAVFGAMIPMTLIPATGAIMADLAEDKAGDGGDDQPTRAADRRRARSGNHRQRIRRRVRTPRRSSAGGLLSDSQAARRRLDPTGQGASGRRWPGAPPSAPRSDRPFFRRRSAGRLSCDRGAPDRGGRGGNASTRLAWDA